MAAHFRSSLSAPGRMVASLALVVVGALMPRAEAQVPQSGSAGLSQFESRSFQAAVDGPVMAKGGQPILVDRLRLAAIGVGERHVFRDFPLPMFESVDLDVVRVTPPGENVPAVLVRGGTREAVKALPLDAFVGKVLGDDESRVVLVMGAAGLSGSIEWGGRKFMLTSGDPKAPHVPAVFDTESAPFQAIPTKPFSCSALSGVPGGAGMPGGGEGAAGGGGVQGMGGAGPCLQVELAFDSDNAFYESFPSAQAALAYMQTLMIYNGEIFQEAVEVTFEVAFWRLWEDEDPWSATNTLDQIIELTDFWTANETSVHRDVVHLVSTLGLGGGIAYKPGLCSNSIGFAVSADLTGFFPTPLRDRDAQNWDIIVFSHETGHNFDATHTHQLEPPVDCCSTSEQCATRDCANANRGTIMSYCHTCSGGVANISLNFAPPNIAEMAAYLDSDKGRCTSGGDCAASPCVLSVSPSQFQFAQAGGCFTVSILPDPASSPSGCEWTIAGQPSWVQRADANCNAVASGSASGNDAGVLRFKVQANAGAARSATFTIGTRPVTVRQVAGTTCTLSLASNALAAQAAAGGVTLAKFLQSGCSWTVTSSQPWLTVTQTSGAGSATARDVTVNFSANSAATARSGALTFRSSGQAEGVTLTVTQAPAAPCTYTTSRSTLSVSAEAGTHLVTVNSQAVECPWTASSDSSWLSVGPTSGSGSRALYIGVQENRAFTARTGNISVSGKVITVTQAAGPDCALGQVTLSSSSATSESPAGEKQITVTPSASWCTWTASSNQSWLTVDPPSGTGTAQPVLRWTANPGSGQRVGIVTIGSKTFTVTQLGVSGSAVISQWRTVGGIGAPGNSSRMLVLPQEAVSVLRMDFNITFRTVGTSHRSELILRVEVPGDATRFLSVRPSTDASQGMTPLSVSGSSVTHRYAGGPFTIPQGVRELKLFCYELADDGSPSTIDALITSGTVSLTFGATAGCSYTLAESEVVVPSGAGSRSVRMTASRPECVWNATSSAPAWLTVQPGGAGSGDMVLSFQRNPSVTARSATITAGGKVLQVYQPGTEPWTPNALYAPKVWMRADAIPAADRVGGLVSRWADLGPGGNALTAPGSSARPRFVPSAVNGKAVLQFDGIDDSLARGALTGSSGSSASGTMMVVWRATAAAASSSRPVVFLSTGASATTPRLAALTGTLGKAVVQGRRPDAGALVTVTSGTAFPATSMKLQAATLDVQAGKLTEFVNGLKVGEASLGSGPASPMVTLPKALRVGSTGTVGQQTFGGEVAEVILVSGSLTQCQRQMLEGYLAHRWGFASSLPASHPFRSAPPDSSNACE